MTRGVNRRRFLYGASAAGAATLGSRLLILPSWARGDSPNEKINVAAIGVGGRGAANLGEVAAEKQMVNIVALCDVDRRNLAAAAKLHARAKTYADFREMIDGPRHKEIDAVLVSTPDHTHAVAAVHAMKCGMHCYCEKPLTYCVGEARTMAQVARQTKRATQMGTQIHASDNYRRVVELIRAGAIGPIREVHAWSAASYCGGDRPKETPPVPAHLDWDLWLGPAPYRPYHEAYLPVKWRGWADFGTGGLGDFFCHYSDLAFWALDLRHPLSVEAEGPPPHPQSTPPWLIVRYEFPSRGAMPPVKFTWYDGGKRPPLQKEGNLPNWRSAVLFVGEKGLLLVDYTRHLLFPEEKFKDFQRPPQSIPKSIGHHKEWLMACKTGSPTTCNFDYSGALAEAALLGMVAYRAGEKIQWDAENLKAVNCPKAEPLIARVYRKGWTL